MLSALLLACFGCCCSIAHIQQDVYKRQRPRDVEFDCAEEDEEHVVIRRMVKSFENHGSEFLYLLDTQEKVFVKELSKKQRPLTERCV